MTCAVTARHTAQLNKCQLLFMLAVSCNVLTVQDAESLLQGLNLFLPASHAILVAHTRVDARWLELLVVRKSSVELLLRAIEVSLLLLQSLLLVLLLARLVLNVLSL